MTVERHPPVLPGDNWNGWDFSVMPADGSPNGQRAWWDSNGQRIDFHGKPSWPQEMWDHRMARVECARCAAFVGPR